MAHVLAQQPVVALEVDRRAGRITLSALHPEGVDHLGTFNTAAEAWAALDELERRD